jgi:hypothetical protein
MDAKKGLDKLKTSRNHLLHFFYCEGDAKGKPVLIFDTKAVTNDEQDEVLQTAKKKTKCLGTALIDDQNILQVKPKGSVPSNLEGNILKAALNANAKVFQEIHIGPVVPEEHGETETEESPKHEGEEGAESWEKRWHEMTPVLEKVLSIKPHNEKEIHDTAELAKQQAGEHDFTKALGSLKRLKLLLQQALTAMPPSNMVHETAPTFDSKVVKPKTEDEEQVKTLVTAKLKDMPPQKLDEFNKKLSGTVGHSANLAEHLKTVMASLKNVEFVSGDDPHMGSGGAYYDYKSHTIKINKDDDPSRMADNLIWESCNAANKPKFDELEKKFNKTPDLNDYANEKAKIEFRTSLKYASLMQEQYMSLSHVQQQQFNQLLPVEEKLEGQLRPLEQELGRLKKRMETASTPEMVKQQEKLEQQMAPLQEQLKTVQKGLDKMLPKSGRGQLREFRKNAPTFFDETDPTKRKEMEDRLETSFINSPQDAKATKGKGTLSSAELYKWEKIVQGGAVSTIGYLKKFVWPNTGDTKPRGLDSFTDWVRTNYPAAEPKHKPKAFMQLLEYLPRYFDDVTITTTQWDYSAKMKQVAEEEAAGYSLPACPDRPQA